MKSIFITAFIFAAALTAYSQPSASEIVFFGSPDGSYNGTEIYSMRPDGSGLVNLTNDTTVPNFSPNWSPDGSKIVFIKNWAMWIMNADGTNQYQLATPPSGSHDRPAWSPDGRKIAFEIGDGFTTATIFVINADGTNQTQLTFNYYSSGADWSPNGSKIVFSSFDDAGHQNIYVMNADGTGRTAITNFLSAYDTDSPKWSPDGSKIAFASMGNIFIMNADGSDPIQITNTFRDEWPSWSPDGKKLAFSSDRDSSLWNIYVVNADGTNVIRLTQNTFYSYSPNWKRVAAPSSVYQLSGRVTTPDGRGLRNATVFMTDSLGTRRTVMTSAFGYYLFDNVAGGQTYTLGVASKLYRFAPQTMQITGTLTDVNFMGVE